MPVHFPDLCLEKGLNCVEITQFRFRSRRKFFFNRHNVVWCDIQEPLFHVYKSLFGHYIMTCSYHTLLNITTFNHITSHNLLSPSNICEQRQFFLAFPLVLLLPKTSQIIWLSNLLTLNVPNNIYYWCIYF